MTQLDRQAVLDMLLTHEGFRPTCYVDITGHLTIGIGFNLDDPGAEVVCSEFGLDYQALRNGSAITPARAYAVVNHQVDQATDVLTVLVRGFAELPANAQLVALDMIFNLGATKFAQFRQTIAAFERQDWPAVAAAMKDSAWYHEVGTRAQHDIALILQLTSVTA